MQTWSGIEKHARHSAGGLVAAQHGGAAEAGARVLAAGGNAMDAAVVTALVLSVAEPWLSGIGGGGFLLHASGDTGAVDTLDFNVRAPQGISAADYPLRGGRGGDWFDWPAVEGDRNLSGPMSVCVPGAIDGLATALARFGTLSWAEALAPAIEAAERGLEVDWFTRLCIAIDAGNLAADPASAEVFLPGGQPPDPGRTPRLPMPAKARTLRRLAQAGARDFYEGGIAASLAGELAMAGAKLSAADLAAYRSTWQPPRTASYRGHEVHVIDGLSGGPSLLAALAALDIGPQTGPAEAALAYATAIRDATRLRLTTMGHASAGGDCTSHVSVVDRAGNMVSLTNTLLSRFGAKVTLPSTGFLLNNGMMWFDPRPGVPNRIAPGARPLANMSPLLLTRGGRPTLAIGAAGGRQIFPALVQLLSFMLDGGMGLEEAFHAPRLDASSPTIRVNRRAAPDVAAKVAEAFPVELVTDTLHPVNFAIPSAVARDPASGRNSGMAHPTSPWAAVAAETEGGPDA
ncbi:gamma-glutamyltransferase [Paroceanicella profunda]|uniref:Gamma-glutamyltransferase n=1 Tax=Paroceanicella profunda TaxID=2579971 RepID=A0A5B8FRJ0_9RHOB|nr:gamma-glutamyltransferase [Paroceanicella profunda]QDL91346.1 gamma-glutamyltransferase [Paroceanicella profunda]